VILRARGFTLIKTMVAKVVMAPLGSASRSIHATQLHFIAAKKYDHPPRRRTAMAYTPDL
jgi:hypothetical protein